MRVLLALALLVVGVLGDSAKFEMDFCTKESANGCGKVQSLSVGKLNAKVYVYSQREKDGLCLKEGVPAYQSGTEHVAVTDESKLKKCFCKDKTCQACVQDKDTPDEKNVESCCGKQGLAKFGSFYVFINVNTDSSTSKMKSTCCMAYGYDHNEKKEKEVCYCTKTTEGCKPKPLCPASTKKDRRKREETPSVATPPNCGSGVVKIHVTKTGEPDTVLQLLCNAGYSSKPGETPTPQIYVPLFCYRAIGMMASFGDIEFVIGPNKWKYVKEKVVAKAAEGNPNLQILTFKELDAGDFKKCLELDVPTTCLYQEPLMTNQIDLTKCFLKPFAEAADAEAEKKTFELMKKGTASCTTEDCFTAPGDVVCTNSYGAPIVCHSKSTGEKYMFGYLNNPIDDCSAGNPAGKPLLVQPIKLTA